MGGFLHPNFTVDQFDLQEGMQVADFGCGSGHLTIIMAGKVGSKEKIHALDVMPNALDSVKVRARDGNLENIETIRTNLEIMGASSLADNSQDMVLMANILFQSNQKENIIKEGIRVLKPGGKLIVIDWKKGVSGFGLPNEIGSDPVEVQNMAERNGLTFERNLNVGDLRFGMVLGKAKS